jgi:hypothetical protein
MSNNHKGKLQAVQAQPTTVAARLIVTAFTDRPPTLECSVDLLGALQLLSAALAIVANTAAQGNKPPSPSQADPVDKKREYLGPRK